MTQDSSRRAPALWSHPLADDQQDLFKSLGFIPGVPVFEADSGFSLRDLRKALFNSTYDAPRVLQFTVNDDTPDTGSDDWTVSMLVLSARVVWAEYVRRHGEVPVACWPEPAWYIEGLLFTSPVHPPHDPAPMRAYIDGIEQPLASRETYIQVERFVTDVPVDEPLRYGIGAPGQAME
jgi:hypothetical protein